jgi:hypothetical protein
MPTRGKKKGPVAGGLSAYMLRKGGSRDEANCDKSLAVPNRENDPLDHHSDSAVLQQAPVVVPR